MSNTRKVTIKEVAKRARVSIPTAARVAGNYGKVSEWTRVKVLAAIKELGYQPNIIARSLVTRTTCSVGLVVTDITNPFFAQITRGVENVTWPRGYTLIVANTDEDTEREEAILTSMRERQVDGLIVVPASSRKNPHFDLLKKESTPIVLIDRSIRGFKADMVMVENKKNSYEAVSHLIRIGHKNIAILLDNLKISTNNERLNGYRSALNDNNIRINESYILVCQYTSQSAYETAKNILDLSPRPTALFTTNNFMTIGALQAIKETGLIIPDDIALIGFDELEWGNLIYPSISVVAQPIKEIGELAASCLLNRIDGDESKYQKYRLNATLIIRESSGNKS